MPLIELRVPTGALTEASQQLLAEQLTTSFLHWRGAPNTEDARANAWVYISEWPAGRQFVAGKRPTESHYVVIVSTVMGGMEPRRKQGLVADFTRLVLAADGALDVAAAGGRVWIFINEVPDATWGAGGQLTTFAAAQAALGLQG